MFTNCIRDEAVNAQVIGTTIGDKYRKDTMAGVVAQTSTIHFPFFFAFAVRTFAAAFDALVALAFRSSGVMRSFVILAPFLPTRQERGGGGTRR